MRFKIGKLLFTVLLAAAAATLIVRSRRREANLRLGRSDPTPTLAQLEFIIPEANFDGIPLESAIDELARMAGAKVRVDWDSLLKDFRVEKSSLVRRRIENAPLVSALQFVVYSAAKEDGLSRRFPFSIAECVPLQDEILVTTSSNPLSLKLELRLYDVNDMANRSFGPAGSGADDKTTPEEQLTSLVASLKYSELQGRDATIIGVFAGRLFVQGTRWGHRKFEQRLYQFRQFQEAPH